MDSINKYTGSLGRGKGGSILSLLLDDLKIDRMNEQEIEMYQKELQNYLTKRNKRIAK